MTNKELADLLLPNVTHDVKYYEVMYPKRNLKEGTVVTRYAPSPTGFVHMGNVYACFVEQRMAKQTDGVFYLRREDTDQKRTVEDGIKRIIDDMRNFDISFDEYPTDDGLEIGNYGSYVQSKRKEIYQTFVKHFIEHDMAYPCFCSEDDLTAIREKQEQNKERIGYYGEHAICRNMTFENIKERVLRGDTYVIRLKSNGNFNRKVTCHDLVKGHVEMPENDLDIVIMKSDDGLPTYHFAHLVDDYLMDTTHVIRDLNWLPSVPVHIQLFEMFGIKPPKYAHIAPLMKNDEGSIRKLSKRKDPEAAVSYYHEKGIPVPAIMIYIATITNSNFEMWFDQNPMASVNDFKFTFEKISKSGPLFDIEKIDNISRNYISKLSATEVYDSVLKWALAFDLPFSELLSKYKDFSTEVFNIERVQKKPRKDFSCWSDIKNQIWYMYDELFIGSDYEFQTISDKNDIKDIVKTYVEEFYDQNDDKETWFNKIKQLSIKLGYAGEVKEFKESPDKFKGHVGDVSMVIRVALTTKAMTPDLYEIARLLGKDRIAKRFEIFY